MTKAERMGLFEVPEGLGQFAFFLVGESPVGEDLGTVGIQVDGLVVVPDGLVELAFLSIDITPVAEGFGKTGFQADGLAEILNGPVELAFVIIGIAPVVEGKDKVRLQANGLIVVGYGPVPLAFLPVGKAPVGVGDGEILPGEPPRLNVPGTGNDLDVGVAAAEITPSNFFGEIRRGGAGPCDQEDNAENANELHDLLRFKGSPMD